MVLYNTRSYSEAHKWLNQFFSLVDRSKGVSSNIREIAAKHNLPIEWQVLKEYKIEGEKFINLFPHNNLEVSEKRKFIDIGYFYDGMGWVNIISWNPENKSVFIRLDGGSNGVDVDMCKNYYDSIFDMKDSNITYFNFRDFINTTYQINAKDDEYQNNLRKFYENNRICPS